MKVQHCIITFLISFFFISKSFAGDSTEINPEERYDAFMLEYVRILKEVVNEKDDSKALSIIYQQKPILVEKIKVIKPALDHWENTLDEAAKNEFHHRIHHKSYLEEFQIILMDDVFEKRLANNSELNKAFEDLAYSITLKGDMRVRVVKN